jgi:hypothetical protein
VQWVKKKKKKKKNERTKGKGTREGERGKEILLKVSFR